MTARNPVAGPVTVASSAAPRSFWNTASLDHWLDVTACCCPIAGPEPQPVCCRLPGSSCFSTRNWGSVALFSGSPQEVS